MISPIDPKLLKQLLLEHFVGGKNGLKDCFKAVTYIKLKWKYFYVNHKEEEEEEEGKRGTHILGIYHTFGSLNTEYR